jgi:hypothetical protein
MDAPEIDPESFALVEAHISQSPHQGPRALPLPKKKRDGFSRQDVVNAFETAFETIGGVSRLALWANANPDRFYPLYTKLLPATSIQFGHGSTLIVKHALPPSPLDVHPGFDAPIVQTQEEDVPR